MPIPRLSKNEFVEKAIKIHGLKYEYNNVVYVRSIDNVYITCKIHGDFLQSPNRHLHGAGCSKCSGNYKKTTKDFIFEANNKHNFIYDYSKSIYTNCGGYVIITCRKHGDFKQLAMSHLSGRGCEKCSGRNKTTKEFILQAIGVHGNKYDYSKFEYTNCKTESIIICSKHNEFKLSPTKHLSGGGCQKCAGRNRTYQEFIDDSNFIHNFKYDYSKFNYIDWKFKSIIICREHGEFKQSANKHLNGRGCPTCGGTVKRTTEDFINESNLVHSFKYDYSKVNYVNHHTYVEIICNEHGSFFQIPLSHINQKSGCIKCSGTYQFDTAEFIKRSKEKHGDIYDYSKSVYENCKAKIIITCKHHGDFLQSAIHHMKRNGCKKCNVTGGYSFKFFKNNPERKDDFSRLYLIKFTPNDNSDVFYKIGISKKEIKHRFTNEQKFYKIHEIFSFKGKLYPIFCLEQRLHIHISKSQQRPNVTKLVGGTNECFYCDDELYIKNLIEIIKNSIEFIS